MAGGDGLEQLQRDVRYLLDRLAIMDVIAKHAHAHDRHDAQGLTDAYHPDGVDEKGWAINAAADYPEWANAAHVAISQQHTHNITTHVCEIDGDVAHCESYVLGALLDKDGAKASIVSGRYVDRLERRDGTWRIALRRTVVDLTLTADATLVQDPGFVERGYAKGMRDARDIWYQRPLTLDDTPADRW